MHCKQLVQTEIKLGQIVTHQVFPRAKMHTDTDARFDSFFGTESRPSRELYDSIYYFFFHQKWIGTGINDRAGKSTTPCEAALELPDFESVKFTRQRELALVKVPVSYEINMTDAVF